MKASHRAQINRENAKKSTGPTSPEGKQIACLNGFKHGLTGQRMILQDHELDAYRRLGTALHAEYRPKTEIESQLVQHIVDCNMRLNRAAAIDSNLLNVSLVENTRDAAHDDITETVIAQTRAWVQQADSFEKLGRYEGRISRQMLQYIRELDRIQNLRKSQVVNQSVAPEKLTEATETKKDNHKLASFCGNGQALSSRTPDQRRIPLVRASFRKSPSPDWLPRVMTAVSIGLNAEAPVISPSPATVIPIQPSYPLAAAAHPLAPVQPGL